MSNVAGQLRFKLDHVYIRILEALQLHGRISNLKLAESVALSASPVLERVKKLESSGVVRSYTADIDLRKICPSVTMWAEVTLTSYSQYFPRFNRAIADIPEIVESYRITGRSDYLMRIVCADVESYTALTDRMMTLNLGIASIETKVVTERNKQFSGYPLRTLMAEERREYIEITQNHSCGISSVAQFAR